MARIRSIKPEFPQSESVGKLSRDARLLFILIWTHVDDEGRSRAASRMLASLLFPYDDDAPKCVGHWLDELEINGFIQRYEVDGSRYLQVVNWLKHQKIDHPSKSKIPPFSDGGGKPRDRVAKPREDSRDLAPDLGPRTEDLGKEVPSADADGRPGAAEPDGRQSGFGFGGDGGKPRLAVLNGEVLAPEVEDPEKHLFEMGKEVLLRGPNPVKKGGGLIASLLRALNNDIAKTQECVDLAWGKQDPGEYLGACLKKAKSSPPVRAAPQNSRLAAADKLLDYLHEQRH